MGRRKAIRSDLVIANSAYTKQRIMECFGIAGERIRIIYELLITVCFAQTMMVVNCEEHWSESLPSPNRM